jgi:fluoride exporter
MKHPILLHILAIGAAGFLGAISRYLVSHYATQWLGEDRAPLGTLLVNVSACFLIGAAMTFFDRPEHPLPAWLKLAVMTGFIGTYSTFSTYLWEVHKNFALGQIFQAVAYMLGSILLGLLAVMLGIVTVRAL